MPSTVLLKLNKLNRMASHQDIVSSPRPAIPALLFTPPPVQMVEALFRRG
jgi:hypothetical protein